MWTAGGDFQVLSYAVAPAAVCYVRAGPALWERSGHQAGTLRVGHRPPVSLKITYCNEQHNPYPLQRCILWLAVGAYLVCNTPSAV